MTIDDFIYENSIVRDNGSEYTADHIDRVIESVCNNYGLTKKNDFYKLCFSTYYKIMNKHILNLYYSRLCRVKWLKAT